MSRYFVILLGLWCAGSLGNTIPKKFQVCTMTLNSVEEIQVFRQHLPSKHFEFVELVPKVSYDPSQSHAMRWFDQSCQKLNIQCDILIISGHFAGTFFGTKNNHMLSIYELEKLACQKGCPRIFKNLKEAYLFGCNTMADKRQVQRTPEEYLNVLMEYDMPRTTAETVVAGRFSPLGMTYKDKMEHIFSPQTRIYGFLELSPLGKQSIPVLNVYLRSIKSKFGSYYKYFVHDFYTNKKKSPNIKFNHAMSSIAAVRQSYGMDKAHPRYDTFQEMCRLHSDKTHPEKKMKIVQQLLKDGDGLFAFSAIKSFLVDRKKNFSQTEAEIFKDIQQLDSVKETFLNISSQVSDALVYVKAVVLHFLDIMEWIPKEEYQADLTATLSSSIASSTLQSYDILSSLIEHDKVESLDIFVEESDFNQDYFQNIWSILMMDLLKMNTPSIQNWIMQFCLDNIEKGNKVICYQALKTLGHLLVEDPKIWKSMAQFLSSEDNGLVYYSLYGLAYAYVSDPYIQIEMVNLIHHKNFWIRLQAIRALDYLGLIQQEPQIKEMLREKLAQEKHPRVVALLENVLHR